MNGRGSTSAVGIVSVFPELLGTYGDGGNAVVLERRLQWRGVPARVISVAADEVVPEHGDVYVLGGGEDGPQAEAARALAEQGVLSRVVDRGAVVFAVCAGFQVLGASFPGADGTVREGLGLLDVTTVRDERPRAVGEVVAEAVADLGTLDSGPGHPRPSSARASSVLFTGYENHAGRTRLGPGVAALGRVLRGVGNGTGDASEGAVCGRVVGTYLHGPVLARNPVLADYLASLVVGPLPPLEDDLVEQLREERLRAAGVPPIPRRQRAFWGRVRLRTAARSRPWARRLRAGAASEG